MLLASLLLLLPSHVSMLLLSSLHTAAGFITFVCIPLLLASLPYWVGGRVVLLFLYFLLLLVFLLLWAVMLLLASFLLLVAGVNAAAGVTPVVCISAKAC
jgi:hypothetical protein